MAEKEPWVMAAGAVIKKPENADTLVANAQNERERQRIQRSGEIETAEHTAKLAELEKKAVAANAATEKTGEKSESVPGFKITGEYNVMDQQRKAEEKAEAAQEQLGVMIEQTKIERDQAVKDLHTEQIGNVRDALKRQEETLGKRLEDLTKAYNESGNLTKRIEGAKAAGIELGLVEPSPGGADARLTLDIKRLDFELLDRQHSQNLEIMRMKDEREDRREERADNVAIAQARLRHDEKKLELIASFPTTIGDSIGAAIFANQGGVNPGQAIPAKVAATRNKPKQKALLEAPEGQGGTTKCPGCKTEVYVGETAKKAVCASCGTEIIISRTSEAPPRPHGGESMEANEDPEE